MTSRLSSGPVRLGIIGVGALALRALLPHLCADDLDGVVSVDGLCDPVPGRARDAAVEYDVARHYETLEDLLGPERVGLEVSAPA